MAVPKGKVSKMNRGNRRSHDRAKSGAWQECPDSGELKLRHHISADGFYNGRQVVQPKVKQNAEAAAE